jgi:hypothetical protein
VYETYSVFSAHTKTKNHQKWLETLNLNKANYYIENIHLRETIDNQKQIIAKMEKEINNKNITVNYLTQQLTAKTNNCGKTVTDLLDFD